MFLSYARVQEGDGQGEGTSKAARGEAGKGGEKEMKEGRKEGRKQKQRYKGRKKRGGGLLYDFLPERVQSGQTPSPCSPGTKEAKGVIGSSRPALPI